MVLISWASAFHACFEILDHLGRDGENPRRRMKVEEIEEKAFLLCFSDLFMAFWCALT